MKLDQTKWYTINYDKLNELFPSCQPVTMENDNLSQAIPETSLTENINKDIMVQNGVSHELYLSSLYRRYGKESVDYILHLVNVYIDSWYKGMTGRVHKPEGKYKRDLFAEKLLECASEFDLYCEDMENVLLYIIHNFPDGVDPLIYYATGDKVLGNALVNTVDCIGAQLTGTKYDINC